jgi:hypothetical protein
MVSGPDRGRERFSPREMSPRQGRSTSSSPCGVGGLSRILVIGEHTSVEEDEMHPELTHQLAAQRIADLHRQAAAQRLAGEVRASHRRSAGRRRAWGRLPFRQPRPARA